MKELPPATLRGQAEFLRAGGYTRRYHGWRTLKDDPVGQHTYNVLNLLLLLFPDCSRAVLAATIRHDTAEWIVGDPPSTAKRRVPGLKEAYDGYERDVWAAMEIIDPMESIAPEEKRQLKICDYLDGMMFCIQERQMGNLLIGPVFRTFHGYLPSLLWQTDQLYPSGHDGAAHELYHALCQQWKGLGEGFE